jgi:hypothetical protein
VITVTGREERVPASWDAIRPSSFTRRTIDDRASHYQGRPTRTPPGLKAIGLDQRPTPP